MTGFERLRIDDAPLRSIGRHRSYDHQAKRMYFARGYPPGAGFAEKLRLYRAASAELRRVIGDAARDRRQLRVQGSEWSSSEVGLGRDWLINTKRLQGLRAAPSTDSLADPSLRGVPLRFVESGESIKHLNRYLTIEGLSLPTSGSNNGQTLAGALSTGTHGSAHDFGATVDFVRGLHILTGPGRSVYVQPASRPIVNDAFARQIDAVLVESDAAFNAALVGLGAFGFVRGVMIEARPLFTLHAVRFFHPLDHRVWNAVDDPANVANLDFSLADAEFPREVVGTKRLHHFQVYFNLNDMQNAEPSDAAVLALFEDAYDPATYEPPDWDDDGPGPVAGAVEFIQAIVPLLPARLTRAAIGNAIRDYLGPYYRLGTIEDLFGGLRPEANNLLTGTAVPRSEARRALRLVFGEYEAFRRVLPAFVSARFVKGTSATLGFTRYDATCVLDIDAPSSELSRRFIRRVWRRMEAAGIPFTVHWGKLERDLEAVLARGAPAPLERMYGSGALGAWRRERAALLESPEVERAFTNAFMERVGLV